MPPFNEDLAEFIGIFLGDGGFRNSRQITISFNRHKEHAYALFIQQLVRQLFGLEARRLIRDTAADLLVSSTALVEALGTLGLPRGSKQRVIDKIPEWITSRKDFRLACLRGLMDTDGCVFQHRYHVNGKLYAYPKLCFAGTIPALCEFVAQTLRELGCAVYVHQRGQRVFMYAGEAVRKYFSVVGTHNSHHRQRFEQYMGEVREWPIRTVC